MTGTGVNYLIKPEQFPKLRVFSLSNYQGSDP
jgi:hypothetical protein